MKKIKEFLRKHWGKLCIAAVCLIVVGYFVNIIFFQNKKEVLTVLVLQTEVDREALTEEIQKAVDVSSREEISIQTLDYNNPVNQGVAVTWLRSGTIDLIIGSEEEMTVFGQYGYLMDLKDIKMTTEKEKFMCGTAEFDDDGNILSVEGSEWVGVYPGQVAGIEGMDSPVISIVRNAPQKENAVSTIKILCK